MACPLHMLFPDGALHRCYAAIPPIIFFKVFVNIEDLTGG